jgi:hypothetical protein
MPKRSLLRTPAASATGAFLLAFLGACADPTTNPAGADAGAPASGDAASVPRIDAAAPAADAAADTTTVEREITFVLAAPDLPPQYVCLAAFEPDANGMPQGDPLLARGPFGVPDPTDPAGLRLVSGLPYGTVGRRPVHPDDAAFFDTYASYGFIVDHVDVQAFAGFGVDSATCKSAYAQVKGTPGRLVAFKPGQIRRGQSWLIGIGGCENASTAPECGGGQNLRTTLTQLDVTPPSSFAGAGDASLGIQVADLGVYAGYQKVDLYLQPMIPAPVDGGAGDDAGPDGGASSIVVPDGPPLPLATGGQGLAFGDLAANAGVGLAAANDASARLLVVAHGTAPYCGGSTPCTTTVTIPIQPFMTRYAARTGGATGAAWSGNQVMALFGRPPGPTENPADVLRLGVFVATF